MNNRVRYFDNFSSAGKSEEVSLVCRTLLCLLLSVLIIGCDKINIFSRPYVATVNGSKIYLDDYQTRLDKKMQMMPEDFLNNADHLKRFEEEILDSMITEKIMKMRAQELNVVLSDTELEDKIKEIKKDYGQDFTNLFAEQNINYEQWKKEFREEMLLQKLIATDVNAKIKISEDEIKDYFDKHRNSYKTDSRIRVAQIVVQDMTTANKVMEKLNSGEDFAKVASKMSIGPEASRGGDLGFITKWVMPNPLDKTIFKLPVNKISPIVQSSYGFHIFKVLESQPAKDRNLADVRQDIMADIRLQKEESAFTEWLAALKNKAVIKKETNIKLKKSNKKN
jgi:parvulin-like peptidyl-prolyl isomerase